MSARKVVVVVGWVGVTLEREGRVSTKGEKCYLRAVRVGSVT